jgi:hypothetical protein
LALSGSRFAPVCAVSVGAVIDRAYSRFRRFATASEKEGIGLGVIHLPNLKFLKADWSIHTHVMVQRSFIHTLGYNFPQIRT